MGSIVGDSVESLQPFGQRSSNAVLLGDRLFLRLALMTANDRASLFCRQWTNRLSQRCRTMGLRRGRNRRTACLNLPAGGSSAPRRSRFILHPFQPLLHPEARLRTPANSGPAATFMVRQIRPSCFILHPFHHPLHPEAQLRCRLIVHLPFLRLALFTADDRASLGYVVCRDQKLKQVSGTSRASEDRCPKG